MKNLFKDQSEFHELEKGVYKTLPNTFETGLGVILAEELGMPERTFKRFIKNKKVFMKLKHGLYRKTPKKTNK